MHENYNYNLVRFAYDDYDYSLMSSKAFELWKQVPHFETFYKCTGGVDIGDETDKTIHKVINVAKERGFPHQVLNAAELREKFPQFSGLPDSTLALYQENAGVLNPNKIRRILFDEYPNKDRNTIVQNAQVEKLEEDDTGVYTITTATGQTFRAKKLAICVGAYVKQFLKKHFDLDIKFEVLRMAYFYWKMAEKAKQEGFFRENSVSINNVTWQY